MNVAKTREVLAALEEYSVEYVVFGAVALNLLGLARATEDLDLFVAPNEDNILRLRAALMSVFNDPQLNDLTPEDLLGDYPAVEYNPPGSGFHVDILTRLGEAYRFSDLERMRVSYQGIEVSVVSPRTLYSMKKDTVRLKDKADAEALRRAFDLED